VVNVQQRDHDRRADYADGGGTLSGVERERVIGAPSLALLALELRAWPELALCLASWPLLLSRPRGDGQPVLVLPPLGANDAGTTPLRTYLRALGYDAVGWKLGTNLGLTASIVDGVPERLERLHADTGRKVSVIGWSAGGILGREAARRNPDAVRQVITLGSPFRLMLDDRYKTHAALLYRLTERWHITPTDSMLRAEHCEPLLRVPVSAIYSRTDGVATWQSCVEDDGPQRENIEVFGSHCGLGHNPAALIAIADRLAQREGEWAPFTPPRGFHHLFPHPPAVPDALDDEAQAS
jgi:pimeloyl-ACP methyl ester carboxylesterase